MSCDRVAVVGEMFCVPLNRMAIPESYFIGLGTSGMKIALLILLGLVLGLLGGAALGVGAGVAWIELVKVSTFEGNSSLMVFFTFMPIGAILGAAAGATLFGLLAARDIEIEPAPVRDRRRGGN